MILYGLLSFDVWEGTSDTRLFGLVLWCTLNQ